MYVLKSKYRSRGKNIAPRARRNEDQNVSEGSRRQAGIDSNSKMQKETNSIFYIDSAYIKTKILIFFLMDDK